VRAWSGNDFEMMDMAYHLFCEDARDPTHPHYGAVIQLYRGDEIIASYRDGEEVRLDGKETED